MPSVALESPGAAPRDPSVPRLRGRGWSVAEYLCTAGPRDRRFEERHGAATIAAVVSGTFHYRGESGEALLHPGALMLGDAGACYECGHEHGVGDRCVALQVTDELRDEIAASVAGSSGARFATPMLPAVAASLPAFMALQKLAIGDDDADASVLRIVERVLATLAAVPPRTARLPARDVARVARVLRALDACADLPSGLDSLAAVAGMSKYHFLRTFRRVTGGVTPHQYVLRSRLRAVARALQSTTRPVAALVYEAGFGDLSTFNAQFRVAFGTTPSAFRHGRPRGDDR